MIVALFRAGAVAGALVLALCSSARADASTDRIRVDVRITPTADGVRAHYKLSDAVTRFPLEYSSGRFRDGTWAVTTPGLSFEGAEIRSTSGRPFKAFDVAVAARNEMSGPNYPCVMKIGAKGRVLYASYFAGRQNAFKTTLHFGVPPGSVILGLPAAAKRLDVDRTFFGDQAAPRYVFLGPKALVRDRKVATYVIGPETPAWLLGEIDRLAARTIPFYTEQAGQALHRKPLFLITTEPSDETSMALQADVTDGPNVAVRFFGDGWADRRKLAIPSLDHSIPHEIAHFWNGHFFRSQNADDAPWLHEGGAEYWARLAQRRLSLSGETDPTAALNTCIELLGSNGLTASHEKVAYACGETLQWFADLSWQQQGRDAFALWREMFERAESNGTFYSATTFRELAERNSPAVAEAFRLVFEPGDASRWEKLPPLLGTLGVDVESAPYPPDKMRNRLVMHFLDQVCSGDYIGKRNFDDHFTLDTGEDCGPLAGDPEVDAVNGHNLFSDAPAAYEAVGAACVANGTVVFSRAGKQEVQSLICAAPLPPLPPTFRIVAGD